MNKIACKTFHINLLKQNVERNLDVNLFSVVTADTIDDKQQIGFFFSSPMSESYLNVDINADLQ